MSGKLKRICISFEFGRLLPQETGGRPGCCGLRFATVLYRAGTGAVKEPGPLHPWRGIRYH
jgi:hypothetical protein